MKLSLTVDKNREFVKGAFSLTLSTLIVKIIGFIYKLPLSYILSDEGMGYFNSAYTVFSFFFLLCTAGVPRAISIIINDTEQQYRAPTLRCLLSTFIVIGLSLSLILLIFAYALSILIGSKGCYPSLLAIAPSLLFVAIGGVLRGYLNGVMSFSSIALSQIFEGVIKLILGMLFAILGVRAGLGYPEIAGLSILGVTLGSLGALIPLYIGAREHIKAKGEIKLCMPMLIKRLFKISAPITLNSAVLGASSIIDLVLIIRLLISSGMSEEGATGAFGNYSTLIIPLINLVIALLTPISAAALPMLCERLREGKEEYGRVLSSLFSVFLFFLIPISLAFALFGREILFLLFDDTSASSAASSLVISSASVLFLGLLTLSNTANEAMKDTKGPLIATLIGVIIKTGATLLLIPTQDIGILGASIASAISYAVSFTVSFVLLMKKGIKVKITKDTICFLLFSISSLYPVRLVYDRVSDRSFNPVLFIIFAIIGGVLYLIFNALFFKTMTKKDKKLAILTNFRGKN